MAREIAWAKPRGRSRSRSREDTPRGTRGRDQGRTNLSSSSRDQGDYKELGGRARLVYTNRADNNGYYETPDGRREYFTNWWGKYNAGQKIHDTAEVWNPWDWGGQHEEESWWKSDEENTRIFREREDRAREPYEDRRREDVERFDERRPDPQSERYQMERPDSGASREYLDQLKQWGDRYFQDLDRRRQETRDLWDPYDEKFQNMMRTREENMQSMKRGWDTTAQDAQKRWDRDRGQILGRWDFDRSRTEGDWLGTRKGILSRWDPRFRKEMGELENVSEMQYELLDELKNAPSTVAEQARQAYDKQLQQAMTLSSMMGRGVSGGRQALENQMNVSNANLLQQTAAERSQEHINRLMGRSTILDKQAALSGQRSQLGLSDAGLRRQLGQDTFNVFNQLSTQEADLVRNTGITSYNIKRQLGIDTANMWKIVQDQTLQNAYERRSNLMDRIKIDQLDLDAAKSQLGMGLNLFAGMRGLDEDERSWQAMFSNDAFRWQNQLSNDAYRWAQGSSNLDLSYMNRYENRFRNDQQRIDQLISNTQEQGNRVGRFLFEAGGAAIGGIAGGPAGMQAGQQLGGQFGGALFGGGGGNPGGGFGAGMPLGSLMPTGSSFGASRTPYTDQHFGSLQQVLGSTSGGF